MVKMPNWLVAFIDACKLDGGNTWGDRPSNPQHRRVANGDIVGRYHSHMGSISVNGSTVTINGNRIIVDGQVIDDEIPEGVFRIEIVGKADQVTCDKELTVIGTIQGNVSAGGSVSCDNVGGNVESKGSVSCDNVGGDAVALNGSISCDDIGGSATATKISADTIHNGK